MIIEINTHSTSPLYEQLRNQVVLGIAAKKLALNEALPSVRSLATDLGINFHTVSKAYSILSDEGYIIIDRRKGAMVAQPTTDNHAFLSKLSQKLALNAAEAICHGMSKNDFITQCTDCYHNAKDSPKNGVAL